MSHIDEQRLMELALAAATPNPGERDHLASCERCAEAFDVEQGMSDWLATVPQPMAPDDFVIRATYAYVAEIAEMSRKSYRTPVLALGGVAAMLLPALMVAASALPDTLARLSSWAVAMHALGEVGFGMLRAMGSPHSPGVMLVAMQAVLLVVGVGVLTRLLWMTSPAQEAVR